MNRIKTVQEKDVELYVICEQMLRRGILGEAESRERRETMRAIAAKYENFVDDEQNTKRRMMISHGIVKRRNAMYKKILSDVLTLAEDHFLERHIYSCIEHGQDPDARLLYAKLTIENEESE